MRIVLWFFWLQNLLSTNYVKYLLIIFYFITINVFVNMYGKAKYKAVIIFIFECVFRKFRVTFIFIIGKKFW